MPRPTLGVWKVKEARRRAWLGETPMAIARDMKKSYQAVYTAVRGTTWWSIVDPPAVPVGYKVTFFRVCTNEFCRDLYDGPPNNGICPACYSYRWRNGERRNPEDITPGAWIEIENFEELKRRYEAGESMEAIVEGQPFSEMTLNRRLHEAGVEVRGNAGIRASLTGALVRQARVMHYEDGMPINEIADHLERRYITIYDAVKWKTWQAAGGPGEPIPDESEEESRKCEHCGLLTTQRLCRFCRAEKVAA